jgi:putative FmdB family regulatory protein
MAMAIYEYRCVKCDHEFEVRRPMSRADEPTTCPQCGEVGRRLPSVFASGESYKLRVPEGEAFRGQQPSNEGKQADASYLLRFCQPRLGVPIWRYRLVLRDVRKSVSKKVSRLQ